ncbi:E3 ubiquitin-protein ligase znrf2-like [Myxocyprinus asiaticus]|uniref:E3 ubiquitin-protein ligase znrf2-like n=1 Tax=Myxocyprinus asiaticus TaxID=70543 RepID=UPI0022231F1B|nr:E3 ubiquitin-protein ligase znrf2-like [Myxocyprinus asiaticus]
MGPKQSSPAAAGVRVRAYSSSDVPSSSGSAAVLRYYAGGSAGQIGERVHSSEYSSDRPGSFIQSAIIPTSGRRDETDGERALLIGSLPAHLSPHLLGVGFHCLVCSKFVCSDEIDVHLLMCFSKPRLNYNEDILSQDSGECSVCLDDMVQGDTIARLPCLCIYHKGCIDEWFEVNRSCPEHPTD